MASRFCLIISSQRSGSTLLCRDLDSFELLGNPKESALPILRGKCSGGKSFEPSDYEQLLKKIHIIHDGIDIYSYKIMLDYGIRVIDGCMPGAREQIRPGTNSDALADYFVEYVKFLETKYDQVLVFVNTRGDLISQIHSRVVAQSTGEHHLEKNASRGTTIDLEESILFERMLRKLPKAFIEFNTLKLIGHKLSGKSNVLCTDYADLVDFSTWEATVYSFLESNNIVTTRRLQRKLKKIIDKDRQESDCSAFKDWMRQFRII